MELHVDERAQVDFRQASGIAEVRAAPHVRAEAGITGFKVHLPHIIMAVVVVGGENHAGGEVVDFEVHIDGIVRDGISFFFVVTGAGFIPGIAVDEQAAVGDRAAREGVRGVREVLADKHFRGFAALVGHDDVVVVGPFGSKFPKPDVPVAVIPAIGIGAGVDEHIVDIRAGHVAFYFDAQAVRLVQLHVHERAQVDFVQGGGKLLVAAEDVRAEAGVACFEIDLPQEVMAAVVVGGKNHTRGNIVDFEIGFHGVVRNAAFRAFGERRVGGLDPLCAVPSAAHQAGLEVGLFRGRGLAAFVVPHRDRPVVARGGLQVVPAIGHVDLPVGFHASRSPHFRGACRVAEHGDFIRGLFHAAFFPGIHGPTEHGSFHVDAHGVFHGFRAQPFHLEGVQRLHEAPQSGGAQQRRA